MTTTGLDLTFNFLTHASNASADGVLAYALDSQDSEIRRRAIHGILQRRTARGALRILEIWDQLNDSELRTVQEQPLAMEKAVGHVLKTKGNTPLWDTALEALHLLSLESLLPVIIDRLETCGDHHQRQRMLATVMDLSAALGLAAREGRGRPSIRQPVIERLAESVRRLQFHRCNEMCDAFLAASSWGDRPLRNLLNEDELCAGRLETAMMQSTIPGVLNLLAGFIRRKDIPAVVERVLMLREDEAFRNSLLRVVGHEPTSMTLKHLRHFPLLRIFKMRDTLATQTPLLCHPGLVHAYTANNPDPLDQISLLLDVLALGRPENDTPLVIAFSHCEELDHNRLMQAAILDAGGTGENDASIAEHRQVLKRALQFLDYPNHLIVDAIRRVMRGLHADRLLEVIEQMPEAYWPRVGWIVKRFDPHIVSQLTDELRNPTIGRRIRAIKAAAACGLINELEKQLNTIAKKDYLEVRIIALQALARGHEAESLETLASAAEGPEGSQRDAAIHSLHERLDQDGKEM